MQQLTSLYEQMGISHEVYEYGEATIQKLAERFAEIDRIGSLRINTYDENYIVFTPGFADYPMYLA